MAATATGARALLARLLAGKLPSNEKQCRLLSRAYNYVSSLS